MTTYKTDNPIGSAAVKDLYDNAQNLDELVNNRTIESNPDRLGVLRKTWFGMEQDFQRFLIDSGYEDIGDYGPGLKITARNQIFWKDGEIYRAGKTLDLPYTTTGDWGEEADLFVAVGDQVLRQQLAEAAGPDTGAAMTGYSAPNSPVARTVKAKLNEYPTLNDYPTLQQAIDANANGTLRITQGTISLPDEPIVVSSPITIVGVSEGGVTLQKTAPVTGIKILSTQVKLRNITVNGHLPTDTSSGIQIGQNDGANGQSVEDGYIPAPQCELTSVVVLGCGNRGIDWQEGAFARFNDVHAHDSKENNFYVSDKAFDASHGDWFTSSAGAGSHGYSINWGVHSLVLAKSFSDGGTGVYLNNTRGTTGNIFVELSAGPFLGFGPDTLACDIHVQFWSARHNYEDGGIGNRVIGMSRGDNNGPVHETFTRTNRLLIKRDFVVAGDSPLDGSLEIVPLTNTTYGVGNTAFASGLIAEDGGVYLRDFAIGHKVFDARGLTSADLSSDNRHIDVWLLGDGQTLFVNGATGTYAPYDGQTIIVFHMGGGAAAQINGYIKGSITTDDIAGTNTSKTYIWLASDGYWFEIG